MSARAFAATVVVRNDVVPVVDRIAARADPRDGRSFGTGRTSVRGAAAAAAQIAVDRAVAPVVATRRSPASRVAATRGIGRVGARRRVTAAARRRRPARRRSATESSGATYSGPRGASLRVIQLIEPVHTFSFGTRVSRELLIDIRHTQTFGFEQTLDDARGNSPGLSRRARRVRRATPRRAVCRPGTRRRTPAIARKVRAEALRCARTLRARRAYRHRSPRTRSSQRVLRRDALHHRQQRCTPGRSATRRTTARRDHRREVRQRQLADRRARQLQDRRRRFARLDTARSVNAPAGAMRSCSTPICRANASTTVARTINSYPQEQIRHGERIHHTHSSSRERAASISLVAA